MTKRIFLKDYQAPQLTIHNIDLHFKLDEQNTRVRSVMQIELLTPGSTDLHLDGEALELLEIKINDRVLTESEYVLSPEGITLKAFPHSGKLEITTQIHPAANATLSGLYVSKNIFCTQCEAHGFRRITYFPDRPDVLTRFTTTIEADAKQYPVLLSNGNLIASGENWATWEDPFLKPCYLFALVAGKLDHIHDQFTTRSGKVVDLFIYCEPGKTSFCHHAMQALKKSMRWDEEVYGREYDLNRFNIVAVSDFNMGAMENKSLNIFNDKYILADRETATDADFQAVETVVAHEYFHNWTGNRVTCRDWFQLSLKEGLTVFREQEFSRDMHSRDLIRIRDVNVLRNYQFPEDAGPMSHPIRPDSYVEINNFYTATVYNKGAEVIRMLHTLLGAAEFRRGMDLYFERHDGKAVTINDLIKAMADASKRDFTQFMLWVSTAGTPELTIESQYEPAAQTLKLTVRQSAQPPMHIPMIIGLLAESGRELPVKNHTLEITETEQHFSFPAESKPILSLLRGFSAPVKLHVNYTDQELLTLMQFDSDGFARWEATQILGTQILLGLIRDFQEHRPLVCPPSLMLAFSSILADTHSDPALLAELIQLPSKLILAERLSVIDVDALTAVYKFLQFELAKTLQDKFLSVYERNRQHDYQADAVSVAKRKFRNDCLHYLCKLDSSITQELAVQHYRDADNMTDAIAALSALNDSTSVSRQTLMDDFYQKWSASPLVLDKWFGLHARHDGPDTLDVIKALRNHPAFTIKNPNKVRALYGSFLQGNLSQFHRIDGASYQFMAEQILIIDQFNPQVSASLTKGFTKWRRYDATRQAQMRIALATLDATPTLSKDAREIVDRSLRD